MGSVKDLEVIARIFCRDSAWYTAAEQAKKIDRVRWKEICEAQPEPLPPRLKSLISGAYRACANQITEREWFEAVPPLSDILRETEEILAR